MDDTVFNRRQFMRILVSAAAAYPLSSLAENRDKLITKIYKEPWQTLAEVQQHLFPAEKNSPGASDIRALEYLQTMMQTPDFEPSEIKLINKGVGWLNDLSKQQYKQKFIQLDSIKKEKILRRIESSQAGSRWLSILLTNIIEALLSDPAYAGNPNGIGWKWLNHQPGFPLPTKSKRYFNLTQPRHRNTKA